MVLACGILEITLQGTLVAVVSTPSDVEKTKGKPRKVGHLKMFVINDLKSESIDPLVKKNIDGKATIDSDNSTSYTNFNSLVGEYRPKVIPKEKLGQLLPCVHIVISNAKRLFLNVFHDITPEYIQNYLDEFYYKFNRWYFGEKLYERLLIAGVSYKNEFRNNIK